SRRRPLSRRARSNEQVRVLPRRRAEDRGDRAGRYGAGRRDHGGGRDRAPRGPEAEKLPGGGRTPGFAGRDPARERRGREDPGARRDPWGERAPTRRLRRRGDLLGG